MDKPIAIYYEHPEWFERLFRELERRCVPFVRLALGDHLFDPSVRTLPYSLLVNRVSAFPSAGSHPQIVLYVQQFLAYLESIGARVINGYHSYMVGTSKAVQLGIFERLGLRYPRARVIHHPDQAPVAADGLEFPVVVKPNVGGSGTGILRFDTPDGLAQAVRVQLVDLGVDHTGLVQEYLRPRDGHIVRVEILDGRLLYSIRMPITEQSFNYCPADGCNVENPELGVEPCVPPVAVVGAVQRVLELARADLGSVEYLVAARDGEVYYYDINPLSNFVANAPQVLGFDPTEKLVDFILTRARR
jgi:hypothetical protein